MESKQKRRLRAPSPAMVVACIGLAVALSGTGYAVTALPRNSVGTPQLKDNAVIGSKVAPNSLSGADINESRLGSIPSEPWRTVGAIGQPGFGARFKNADYPGGGLASSPIGFYKDDAGVVHLRGTAEVTGFVCGYEIFYLPPGYRPAVQALFNTWLNTADGGYYEYGTVPVRVGQLGDVTLISCTAAVEDWIGLDVISFRAAS